MVRRLGGRWELNFSYMEASRGMDIRVPAIGNLGNAKD
jgi:hypothetical protein